MQSLNCACNVVSLANFIFKRVPSFKEICECQAGCTPIIKPIATITISEKELKGSLKDAIKAHLTLPPVPCYQKSCDKMAENKILQMGKCTKISKHNSLAIFPKWLKKFSI